MFTWTAPTSRVLTKRVYGSIHHNMYAKANVNAQAEEKRNVAIEAYLLWIYVLYTEGSRRQQIRVIICGIRLSAPSSFCTHVGRFGLRQYLGKGYCFIKRRDEAFSITRRPILNVF